MINLNINQNDDILIHLDLADTYGKSKKEMRDFLFEFLILKTVYVHDKIFCIGENVEIKIELPVSFYDFDDKFKILTLFNKSVIKKEETPKLLFLKENEENQKLIANYFDAEKNNELTKSDINKEKTYSIDECEKFLKLNGYDDFDNYYQKDIFIKILGSQLKTFSNCVYYMVNVLKENEDPKSTGFWFWKKIPDLVSTRLTSINSFKILSKYFTKSAFSSLIKKATNRFQQNRLNFNEDEIEEEHAKILSQENFENSDDQLTFDKVLNQNSLVFFNDDGMSLSIISRKKNKDYNKLKDLYNSNSKSNNELIDYENLYLNQNAYFKELVKVFYIKEKDVDRIYKSIGNYVFTADNFIKMIIILIKLRENIAVILMGETGCGKTKLVEVMSKLKGNDFHIFNIHAGIDDDAINNFMINNKFIEDKNSINDEKNVKEIWIFLDEINTCHSMGLISEMMIKHTLHGQKIKKNIKFIGACNPYKTLNENQIISSVTGLVSPRF